MLFQLSYVLIPWIRMPAIPNGWFSILSFKGMIFSTMLPNGILFYASINKAGTRPIVANRARVRCGRAGVSEWARLWVRDMRKSPSRALKHVNQTLYKRFPPLKKRVTDQPTDRRTDGPTDRRTDRRTDKPSYRDARTHLKNQIKWVWTDIENSGQKKKPKRFWLFLSVFSRFLYYF